MKKIYHVQYSYTDNQGHRDYMTVSGEDEAHAHRSAERLLESIGASDWECEKEEWV